MIDQKNNHALRGCENRKESHHNHEKKKSNDDAVSIKKKGYNDEVPKPKNT